MLLQATKPSLDANLHPGTFSGVLVRQELTEQTEKSASPTNLTPMLMGYTLDTAYSVYILLI